MYIRMIRLAFRPDLDSARFANPTRRTDWGRNVPAPSTLKRPPSYAKSNIRQSHKGGILGSRIVTCEPSGAEVSCVPLSIAPGFGWMAHAVSEGYMNIPIPHLDGTPPNQGRRAERRTSPALSAYHWKGASPRHNSVRDISSTGAFLLTQERWQPGEIFSLSLQRSGPPEKENSFSVQAKAVRWDDQGVAVSFVLPAGADLRLWQSPLKSASEQNEPEDILREFRVAQTISFLSRISPDTHDAVSKLLHEELSNYRLENAIDITLKAERMLGAAVEGDHLRAKPHVAMRIVEAGSWAADDKWMLQFWPDYSLRPVIQKAATKPVLHSLIFLAS